MLVLLLLIVVKGASSVLIAPGDLCGFSNRTFPHVFEEKGTKLVNNHTDEEALRGGGQAVITIHILSNLYVNTGMQ